MNFPTTRCSTPAAAPRTGRGESALPRDPGAKTQSLPFAALPHDLAQGPPAQGNRTAIVLAAALLEYARARDSLLARPTARLAEDLGCCQQTVRNALAALQADRLDPGRARGQQSDRPGYLADLVNGAGNRPPTPSNRLDLPLKPAGEPPLKPVGPESRDRGRRRE